MSRLGRFTSSQGKETAGNCETRSRTIRFNREVIEQWIANGCPPVDTKGQAEAAHVG